jgi:type IV secretory pathway TraG/TraD family ATPase VirD4
VAVLLPFREALMLLSLAFVAAMIVDQRTLAGQGLPVWFVLEEFPALGHMRSIESAAGLMAVEFFEETHGVQAVIC